MNFDIEELYVASAEDGTEKIASNTVTPTGTLPEGTEGAVIGSITINIAQCPIPSQDDLGWLRNEVYTITNYSGYAVVDDPSAVESGTQYILTEDKEELEEYLGITDWESQQLAAGAITQEEYNQQFYRCKAYVANFAETKVYTKP